MSKDPIDSAPKLKVVAGGKASGDGKRKRRPPSRDSLPDGALTEDAIALMFTAEHRGRAHFDHEVGRWAFWDPDLPRWQWDRTQAAAHWCRELARDASEGQAPKVLERVRRKGFLSGVEAMCRADPVHAVTHEVWDSDPMLLGAPGVTVDLRTGEMRAPRPEDMITRLTAVAPDPSADCPLWREFVADVCHEDDVLEAFIQDFAGYTLTGSVKEHQMLFIHGDGGNGKSLLLNTLAGILGDYAQAASMDTFASSKFERHSTDLAAMRGARMVAVSEVSEGVGWNQQRLATMTGGDKVRARFMRQDEFEYYPQFKLWVVGNHKPELGNVNDAMRRRMNIVPFSKKIDNPDTDMFESLKAEWPAILHWMIRGCLAWQREGLRKPDVVRKETEEYFGQQDTFGQWLVECCSIDRQSAHCWEVAVNLYHSWRTFAEARRDEPGTAKGFAEMLKVRGFRPEVRKVQGKAARIWHGIMLIREGAML